MRGSDRLSNTQQTQSHYQNLLRKEAIDHQSIKTVHDLRRILLVEKPTLRKNQVSLSRHPTEGKAPSLLRRAVQLESPLRFTMITTRFSPISLTGNGKDLLSRQCAAKGLAPERLTSSGPGPRSPKSGNSSKTYVCSSSKPCLLLDVLQPIEQIVDAINTFRPGIKSTQMHLPRYCSMERNV